MERETLSALQKRLLPLTIAQLFDRLRDQFISLFSFDLLDEDQSISAFTGTPTQFKAVVSEFIVLAEMTGVNLEKAVWSKYPRKCPYCDAEQCECGEHKRNPHRRLRIRFPDRGLSIGEAQRMLAKIYPPHPLREHILKVVEEIEEAKGEMITPGKDRDTQDEFADVFARMAALATHLGIDLEDMTM